MEKSAIIVEGRGADETIGLEHRVVERHRSGADRTVVGDLQRGVGHHRSAGLGVVDTGQQHHRAGGDGRIRYPQLPRAADVACNREAEAGSQQAVSIDGAAAGIELEVIAEDQVGSPGLERGIVQRYRRVSDRTGARSHRSAGHVQRAGNPVGVRQHQSASTTGTDNVQHRQRGNVVNDAGERQFAGVQVDGAAWAGDVKIVGDRRGAYGLERAAVYDHQTGSERTGVGRLERAGRDHREAGWRLTVEACSIRPAPRL